jgi:osmoprotectant transport system substrate-binding protein
MTRTRTRLAAVALAAALVAAACGDDDDGDASATTAAADTTAAPSGGGTITFKPLDAAGPLTAAALNNGDIDLAAVFTSFVEEGWVVLEDDKGLQPVQNLVVVGRSDKVDDAVADVLGPVLAPLTTDELAEMNRRIGNDKADPADVATEWLEGQDLLAEGTSLDGVSLTVGSANFSEQELVASMVSQVLAANGADVSEKFKLGSREVVAPALEAGEIDVYVEYVGAYLNFLGGTPSGDLDQSLADLRAAAEPKGIVVLDPAPAEDKDGLAVLQETADTYSLTTISDLASVTDDLVMGGPPECPERDFCILGYERVYGLSFEV